jgi:putative ABC transport system permease protein
VLIAGAAIGLLSGSIVAFVLVKLLTGVFDPPPETLAIPWSYLSALIAVTVIAVSAAVAGAMHSARTGVIEKLRGRI